MVDKRRSRAEDEEEDKEEETRKRKRKRKRGGQNSDFEEAQSLMMKRGKKGQNVAWRDKLGSLRSLGFFNEKRWGGGGAGEGVGGGTGGRLGERRRVLSRGEKKPNTARDAFLGRFHSYFHNGGSREKKIFVVYDSTFAWIFRLSAVRAPELLVLESLIFVPF